MTSSTRIGPAQEADLGSIRNLLVELSEAMTDKEGLDIDLSVENCRALIGDPSQYVLVARKGDDIAGFINFSMRKTVMHPAPSALIDELVVSRSTRGSGIGKELIRAAIDISRQLGCCEVEVSTEKSNTKARRFYRACGFDEDAVLLELNLEADAE